MAYQKYLSIPNRRGNVGDRDHFQHIENALQGVVPGPGEVIVGGADGPVARAVSEIGGGIDNRAALRRFRAALVNGTGPVDVVGIGDSITERGGTGGNDGTRWLQVMVDRLRKDWQPDGVAGSRFGYMSANPPDFSFTGTATVYELGGLQMRGRTMSAGATATYTETGTGFRVMFQQRTSGGATASIDGGDPIPLSTTGADVLGGRIWDSPVLPEGEHTLVLTCTSSPFVLEGAYAFRGDHERGIRLWESAKSGTSTSQWLTNTRWSESVVSLDPALVILALGVNDYEKNTGHAQFATNLQTLVGLVRGDLDPAPSVAFLIPFEREAPSATLSWEGYRQAYRDVAAADGDIAILDIAETVGERTSALAAGILDPDLVHPTAYGNRLIGADVAGQLAP